MLTQSADSMKRWAPRQAKRCAPAVAHQRQPDGYTCVPTSVAILAGVPVEQILEEARAHFGVPARCPWQLIRAWAGPRQTEYWLIGNFFGSEVVDAYRAQLAELIFGPPPEPPRLPRGRGILQVFGPRAGHCVAYADGLVFDPELPEPLPYREWRSLPALGAWRVGVVLPVVHPKH